MHDQQILFQSNSHGRDYVYEISTLYLIARVIHLSAKLGLVEHVTNEGTSIDSIQSKYLEYEKDGIVLIIDILVSMHILRKQEDNIKIYPTELTPLFTSLKSTLTISETAWCSSYHILSYLKTNPDILNHCGNKIRICIEHNSMRYFSSDLNALLLELTNLHLLSRALRFATESGLFEIIARKKFNITMKELVENLNQMDTYQTWLDNQTAIPGLLQLLSRYRLLHYDKDTESICFTNFSHYLLQSHPESIYPAMLMVDTAWWNAAANLEISFKINSKSAFEETTGKSFYQHVSENPQRFAEGMAAISLFEDRDVADSCRNLLGKYEYVIDIGGGNGGLIRELSCSHTTPEYILFEKAPADKSSTGSSLTNLEGMCRSKMTHNIRFRIALGDFYLPPDQNGIPRHDNAAYFIKCVLHNISRENVITLLRNIRLTIGRGCQLFLAERIVPPDCSQSHTNITCNVIMRLLFNAESHNIDFYRDVFEAAGFNLDSLNSAVNYMVFVATEKPELIFQKTTPPSSRIPLLQLIPRDTQATADATTTPPPNTDQSAFRP